VVTLDGGDASFRALDWALKNVARKKACADAHFASLPTSSLTCRQIPADTVHLINVIPLDRTYSPYSFQPLNIVADPNLPQLDPELRSGSERQAGAQRRRGCGARHGPRCGGACSSWSAPGSR
jgi:hypothetical protein